MRRLTRRVLLLATLVCAAGLVQSAALPFIEDDYPRALAEARSRKVPLFVEIWAPW